MSRSLVIKGPAFADNKLREVSVRIVDGVISAIAEGDPGQADQVIELGPRQILLPAALDLLCGMRDWIAAQKETVETATKGALAGGITVVCDQANIVPRLNTVARISERTRFVAERAYTDFGVAAAPPLELSDVDQYREAGAYAIGFYSWNLRNWRYPRDLDDSEAIFRRYAQAGMPGWVVVDEAAFQETPLQEVGESHALGALLRRLDPRFRARVHVTKPSSVEMCLAAKERLPNLVIQAPHHALSIDKDTAYNRIGSAARHHPPLRTAEEVAKMKEYAAEGKIEVFVAYHAPHRTQDKFANVPVPGELVPKAGFSAIDISYPHFLTRLGIETTCRGYCENPARHLGLKKGRIARGYDADLVIFEQDSGVVEQNSAVAGGFTEGVWKVEPQEFFSLGKVTPFVGERLRYRVLKTFLRGEEAFDRATRTHQRRPVKRVESPAS
jgi:dihydroorotase